MILWILAAFCIAGLGLWLAFSQDKLPQRTRNWLFGRAVIAEIEEPAAENEPIDEEKEEREPQRCIRASVDVKTEYIDIDIGGLKAYISVIKPFHKLANEDVQIQLEELSDQRTHLTLTVERELTQSEENSALQITKEKVKDLESLASGVRTYLGQLCREDACTTKARKDEKDRRLRIKELEKELGELKGNPSFFPSKRRAKLTNELPKDLLTMQDFVYGDYKQTKERN